MLLGPDSEVRKGEAKDIRSYLVWKAIEWVVSSIDILPCLAFFDPQLFQEFMFTAKVDVFRCLALLDDRLVEEISRLLHTDVKVGLSFAGQTWLSIGERALHEEVHGYGRVVVGGKQVEFVNNLRAWNL